MAPSASAPQPAVPEGRGEPRPFCVQRIDHVVLRCRDVDVMRRFYCDVLGFVVAKHNAARGLWHLRGGTAMIDLVAASAGEAAAANSASPRNMDHVCLRVEPFDLGALEAYFRQRGLALGEHRTRFGAEGDGPSIYLDDPEGNRVELKGAAVAPR